MRYIGLLHITTSSTQPLWRLYARIPLQFTDYWALGPKVCSDMPTNWEETGVVYGSFARMALYFSVLGQREDWRSVTNCTGCHWLTYRHSIIPSDFLASLSHRPIKERMDNVTIKHNLFTRCTKNWKWSWLTFNHFFFRRMSKTLRDVGGNLIEQTCTCSSFLVLKKDSGSASQWF